jgi:hypothetical protein
MFFICPGVFLCYLAVIIAKKLYFLCFCVQKYTSKNLIFLDYLNYTLSRRVSSWLVFMGVTDFDVS